MSTEDKIKHRVQLIIQRGELEKQYEDWKTEALPAEVKLRLQELDEEKLKLLTTVQEILHDLEAEKVTALENIDTSLKAVEEEIKIEVLAKSATCKVDGIGMAVYNKGRVTWETKGLDGLMVAVPELAKFRKEGEPYVTFR